MSNEREVTAEVLSRGSGRGANLLPAWMTHPDLSSQVVIGKTENQDHPQDHKQEVIPPTTEISTTVATEASIKEVTARAGRGISILPAWMTAPGLGAEVAAEMEAEAKDKDDDKDNDNGSDKKLQKRTRDDDDIFSIATDDMNKRDLKKAKQSNNEQNNQDGNIYGPGIGINIDDEETQLHHTYGSSMDTILSVATKKATKILIDEEELSQDKSKIIIKGALKRAMDNL